MPGQNRGTRGGRRRQSTQLTNVAGGGGGGGILIYLATTFLTPPWQDIVIYISPTIAVVFGVIFSFGQTKIMQWNADRAIREELNKAKEHLRRIESDQHSTAEHKATARKKVEALERLVFDVHDRRITELIETE